jgi:hypothetical protein
MGFHKKGDENYSLICSKRQPLLYCVVPEFGDVRAVQALNGDRFNTRNEVELA